VNDGDALFDLDDLERPEAFAPPKSAPRGSEPAQDSAPGAERPAGPAQNGPPQNGPSGRLSAALIAELLELPPPTAQQRAVIEAPLEPRIVIAGAGSGKTETMANRVVWLIANGLVRVPEVLGLTFTRKAAGELAERIRTRLQQLAAANITELVFDPFDAPTIATYNAFANSIFRENAVVIGREGEAAVLSEASAWQLARTVVVASADERLREMDKSVDVVTSAVLALSRALAENVVVPGEVIAYAERFSGLLDLPPGTARTKGVLAEIVRAVGQVSMLPLLVQLAEAYAAEKVRRGYVEYSDQIALALAIVESTPRVVEEYRDRFRVVLLDEYQDTSVVQTRLLAALFREQGVMAVGDPHQSIYGWRGASAANLARFDRDFAAGLRRHPYALSTSWRNPRIVLDAANTLVQPLSAESAVPVEQLGPRPGVKSGSLRTAFRETVTEEAQEVAAWFAAQLAERDGDGRIRSAALLCRSVKKIEPFTAALDARGIPYHVLGIGGLLGQPAVADLVSMLRVLYYPTAGPDLLRVLGGARWRIGTKDLMALRALASWIAQRDHRFQRLDAEVAGRLRGSVVADEDRSIIDALDFVATASPEHGALEGFTAVGLERLRRAAAEFSALRSRAGLGLIDYVDLVQQELLLDIEVLASPHATAGRAALDAFAEQLGSFLALDPAAGLGEFLSWLEEAEKRDRLEPRSEEPEPGTVQILTIHGAKGLEWDVVAIPRMVAGELPGEPMSKLGWLAFGELPFDFRGDSAELPAFAWRGADTQGEVKAALEEFRTANSEHYAAEQRRLIYVAVTRAKSDLLVSGSFWTTGVKRPRGPGLYLRELEATGVLPEGVLPEAPEHEENPLAEAESWVEWPRDPLGARRSRVAAAAEAVRAADPGVRTTWDHEIEVLLAERAARGVEPLLDVPVRLPASRFKDYVSDPQKVARSLQRPMPERPYRQTRLGTRFHTWVEERYRHGDSALVGLDDLDAWLGELEPLDDELETGLAVVAEGTVGAEGEADAAVSEDADDETAFVTETATATAAEDRRLDELIAVFERSPYAVLQPVEVEVEVHLVLAGRVIVCKIDAIFREGDRFEVVDWKTGKAPSDAADLELKQLQLALYRLAYARWRGIDEELVDASFYFVADDAVIRPERLFSADELEALLLGSAL
jgi:DNA helicase-2/ATP-dependent DNA helicase PcrA